MVPGKFTALTSARGPRSIINLLPPFHNVRLSSITHIYLDVNESRHMYMFIFINIYMYVDNARKSYIVKRREYYFSVCYFSVIFYFLFMAEFSNLGFG